MPGPLPRQAVRAVDGFGRPDLELAWNYVDLGAIQVGGARLKSGTAEREARAVEF
jgi:hypothetical protein